MYDKCEYDENAVRKRQMLFATIRGTCTISANVRCKRLQEFVKSIIKDEKNVLKPKTIFSKIPSGF